MRPSPISAALPLSLLLLLLPFLHFTSSQQINFYHGPTAAPPTTPREGAQYGSEQFALNTSAVSADLVFAGGVNTLLPSPTNFTAFTDIWIYNVSNSSYQQAEPTLPSPSYFGGGGYSTYYHALFLYSGRTNTAGSGVANTYFADLMKIDWSSYWNGLGGVIYNPTVSTITLTPPATPRQHAASLLVNYTLYVLGGMTGATGMTVPSDQFFAIHCDTGVVTALSQSRSFPSQSVVSPVLTTNMAATHLYVYSGLMADYQTFVTPYVTYIYQIATDTWLSPLSSVVSSFQSGVSLPNVAFASILSLGNRAFLMDGGCNSTSGSTTQLAVWQPPQLSPTGSPELVTFYYDGSDDFSDVPFLANFSILTARQRGMVGVSALVTINVSIVVNLWWYGGATYASSTSQTALSYQTNTTVFTIFLDWADIADANNNGGGALMSSTGGSAPSSSSSSSSSSNNAATIAASVLGAVMGVALLIGLAYLIMSRNSKGTNQHSQMKEETPQREGDVTEMT